MSGGPPIVVGLWLYFIPSSLGFTGRASFTAR